MTKAYINRVKKRIANFINNPMSTTFNEMPYKKERIEVIQWIVIEELEKLEDELLGENS